MIEPQHGSLPASRHVLTEAGVKVSMDGKGRWMDNIFIERLWRMHLSLRVETGSEAQAGIGR